MARPRVLTLLSDIASHHCTLKAVLSTLNTPKTYNTLRACPRRLSRAGPGTQAPRPSSRRRYPPAAQLARERAETFAPASPETQGPAAYDLAVALVHQVREGPVPCCCQLVC